MGFLTSIGLAIPAGLNACIPLLAVAVANDYRMDVCRAKAEAGGCQCRVAA